jgi:predicted PurR-regulated permease PerM
MNGGSGTAGWGDEVGSMEESTNMAAPVATPGLIDHALRLALVAALAIACMIVVAPFVTVVLWAALLAVMLWPLHAWLRASRLMSNARSASLIGIVAVGLLAAPLVLLLNELAEFADRVFAMARTGTPLPPAPVWLASLPVIGAGIAESWEASRGHLGELLSENSAILKLAAMRLAGGLASFLTMMASLVLAAVFLAFGDKAAAAAVQIAVRVTGDSQRGSRIVALTTMTIRGVLQGVVGVAFIQALLIGAGLLFVGVPYAGVLIVVTFLIGVLQLPALILTIPVIAWGWSHLDSTSAGIFTVYCLLAGVSDQVLKPILLGRGIDAPMPVILIGVIGGMIGSGLLGLFVGPVVLAIGYVLFVDWLQEREAI